MADEVQKHGLADIYLTEKNVHGTEIWSVSREKKHRQTQSRIQIVARNRGWDAFPFVMIFWEQDLHCHEMI
jgi:hypothetical protein